MERKKVSLNIPVDVLERIDKLAATAEMDRTRLMVNMLDVFSKPLVATKWVGLLQLTVLIRDAGDKLKEWREEVDKKKSFKGVEKE